MMNDELNIHDEFEDWLKQSADKHRMYPSDKLWRNINGQLHEQPNWPALTFGAILTLALITATLVFLHPTKNVFTTIDYAYNATPTTVKQAISANSKREIVEFPKPSKLKEPVYAFNTTNTASDLEDIDISFNSGQPVADLSLAVATNRNAADVAILHSPVPKIEGNKVVSTGLEVANPSTELAMELSPAFITTNEAVKEDVKQTLEEEQLTKYGGTKTIQLPKVSKKHWHVEVYGGSNISYRRLRESMFDNHIISTQPTGSDRGNLNNIVSQKPSIGVNAGVAFVYAVSDRLRIKTGVQFNFRQYNIDAYKSHFERSVLLLNNSLYYPDSVYTYSAISNEQGKSIALTNKYYQIGIPVGIEWTAVKLPNLHFNIAANVQPTYQLNSNNYLLTSDYKSYVQAPDLLRRININAGVEATANFRAGNLQWQVGPQVLYQTMPTQKNNYSIHEHLIDYGVRVGIIKQL